MVYVYILRCADGSLYTGVAADVERRFRQHRGELKGGAKYTRSHPPVSIEAVFPCETRSEALQLEHRIKTMSREEKEKILTGRSEASDKSDLPSLK